MARVSKSNPALTLMQKSSNTYPIRAVSLMTGVSIDTLRAWERRYNAVTPMRDDRGRVYSTGDVHRITLLRDAVQSGHAIGRVAKMTTEQLEQLSTAAAPSVSPMRAGRALPVAINITSIIAALERFDAAAVEADLGRAAAMLRPPELLRELLVPVLTEVGERWHSGHARIAHEHMLSASVRNVLGSLLRVHMRAGVPDKMLFATPSGERHEFGTLGAALLAASGGLGTIYLGPDMPAADIIAVTAVVRLEVVVLGVTDTGDTVRVDKEVQQVAKRLPSNIELWLGGRSAARMAKALKGRALALPDYAVLEQQLVRMGARF